MPTFKKNTSKFQMKYGLNSPFDYGVGANMMKSQDPSAFVKDDKFVANNPNAKDPMEGKEYNPNVGKPKKDPYADAAKKDANLNKYVSNRKNLKKGSAEYGINQHKINTAYYDKATADKIYADYRKKYNLGPTSERSKEKAITLNTKKLKKIDNINESGRNVELRTSEVNENFAKKNTRRDKKGVRQGGGTKQEIAAADVRLEQAKIDDMKGSKGGRKGIFRGLREKLALKRKERSQRKADSPAKYKKKK